MIVGDVQRYFLIGFPQPKNSIDKLATPHIRSYFYLALKKPSIETGKERGRPQRRQRLQSVVPPSNAGCPSEWRRMQSIACENAKTPTALAYISLCVPLCAGNFTKCRRIVRFLNRVNTPIVGTFVLIFSAVGALTDD